MSHTDPAEKLVMMANQIGLFFGSQRHGDAGEAVALHLRKFWTPIMRDQIRAHLDAGGAGLNAPALDGVMHLSDETPKIPVGHDDDSSEHAHGVTKA